MSIQSEIDRINNAKSEIASAISEKGVEVAEGTSIDDLPGLVRSIPQEGGSGGISAQVQADYTQNDSTKVDFIKNRPFYTEDKYTHNVIFGDENTDYSMYKIGDIVPLKDYVYEIAMRMTGDLGDGVIQNVTFKGNTANSLSIDENTSIIMLTSEEVGETALEAIIVYQGTDEETAGIYIPGFLEGFEEGFSCEIDVIPYKRIEQKYITPQSNEIIVDLDLVERENIPLSPEQALAIYYSMFSGTPIDLKLKAMIGADTQYIYAKDNGLGIFEVHLILEGILYSFNLEDMQLVEVKRWTLGGDNTTEPTATTYGLRKPSLADQIYASLEERGLTLARFREKFLNKGTTE